MAHAHVFGLATDRRHLTSREQGRHRRHGLERAVGVPELVARLVLHPTIAPVHQALLGLRIDVREIHHVLVQTMLLADRPDRLLQGAEARGERHLLLVGESLVGEDEHGVFLERIVDSAERRLVHRRSEVDTIDAGAEHAMDGRDGQRGHAKSSLTAATLSRPMLDSARP